MANQGPTLTTSFLFSMEVYFEGIRLVLDKIFELPKLPFNNQLLHTYYSFPTNKFRASYLFIYAYRGGDVLDAMSTLWPQIKLPEMTRRTQLNKTSLPSPFWLLTYHAVKGHIQPLMTFWDHFKPSLTIENLYENFLLEKSIDKRLEGEHPVSILEMMLNAYLFAKSKTPRPAHFSDWQRLWGELLALLKTPRFVRDPIDLLLKLPEKAYDDYEDFPNSLFEHPRFNFEEALERAIKCKHWILVQHLIYHHEYQAPTLRALLSHADLPDYLRLECFTHYVTDWPLEMEAPDQTPEQKAFAKDLIVDLEAPGKKTPAAAMRKLRVFLMENEDKIDSLHKSGWQVLNAGVATRNAELIDLLLEKRVNFLLTTDQGCNPLTIARAFNDKPLIIRILKKIKERKLLSDADFNRVLFYLMSPDGVNSQVDEYMELFLEEDLLTLTELACEQQEPLMKWLGSTKIQGNTLFLLLESTLNKLAAKYQIKTTQRRHTTGFCFEKDDAKNVAQFQALQRTCRGFRWLKQFDDIGPFSRISPAHNAITITLQEFFKFDTALHQAFSKVTVAPQPSTIAVAATSSTASRTFTPMAQAQAVTQPAVSLIPNTPKERSLITQTISCDNALADQLINLANINIYSKYLLLHYGLDGSSAVVSRTETIQRLIHLLPFLQKLDHASSTNELLKKLVNQALMASFVLLGVQFSELNCDKFSFDQGSIIDDLLSRIIMKYKDFQGRNQKEQFKSLPSLIEDLWCGDLEVLRHRRTNMHIENWMLCKGIATLRLNSLSA